MELVREFLIIGASFAIISIAARQIAKYFPRFHLPVITGLLLVGMLSGPFVLHLLPERIGREFRFVNEISLSFIAFAAGAELYLKELKSRLKSIKWMTFGQLFFTFVLSSLTIYFLAAYIPFISGLPEAAKISISILSATIFVARSPVSAIAIINELRAKGPFTQTAIGVTVLKDVLVIILFTINFALADAMISNVKFDIGLFLLLFFELLLSFAMGLGIGWIIKMILRIRIKTLYKSFIILLAGYSVYIISHALKAYSEEWLHFEIYAEPLLICIIGSFYVTNYTLYRREFLKIINDLVPYVYVIFFTYTGAIISLDVLKQAWFIALLFFFIRLVTMTIGSWFGGRMGGDPPMFRRLGWMPYVTQAGVGLGLVTVVAGNFPEWGTEFSTIMITVIVLNQVVGPPLFKFAIMKMGEAHIKGEGFEGHPRAAMIFGLESQSVALARQLLKHDWEVSITTRRENIDNFKDIEIPIHQVNDFSIDTLKEAGAHEAETLVLMKTDEENLKICEIAYENFGSQDLIVRLNNQFNYKRFLSLGALVVEPSTAMVSLLDHSVRSPMATSLLLGLEKDQDMVDVVMMNSNLDGLTLRELHMPHDILIVSTKRKGQLLISTGYTRLRMGDVLTIVGSVESIENVRLRFEG